MSSSLLTSCAVCPVRSPGAYCPELTRPALLYRALRPPSDSCLDLTLWFCCLGQTAPRCPERNPQTKLGKATQGPTKMTPQVYSRAVCVLACSHIAKMWNIEYCRCYRLSRSLHRFGCGSGVISNPTLNNQYNRICVSAISPRRISTKQCFTPRSIAIGTCHRPGPP